MLHCFIYILDVTLKPVHNDEPTESECGMSRNVFIISAMHVLLICVPTLNIKRSGVCPKGKFSYLHNRLSQITLYIHIQY